MEHSRDKKITNKKNNIKNKSNIKNSISTKSTKSTKTKDALKCYHIPLVCKKGYMSISPNKKAIYDHNYKCPHQNTCKKGTIMNWRTITNINSCECAYIPEKECPDYTTSSTIVSRNNNNKCFDHNIDYYGNDIKKGELRVKSVKGCQLECQNNDECKYFSYEKNKNNSNKKNKCWLKTKKTDDIRKDNKRISGPKYCN